MFANRDWNIIAPIEELQPKVVTLKENTYQVVCCYWNDWNGLVRETVNVCCLECYDCNNG